VARTGLSLVRKLTCWSSLSGISEKSKESREVVVERCTRLGFAINKAHNEGPDVQAGDVVEIGKGDQRDSMVFVCRTNEQACQGSPVTLKGIRAFVARDGEVMCLGTKVMLDVMPYQHFAENKDVLFIFTRN
jgi:hypothetical protein